MSTPDPLATLRTAGGQGALAAAAALVHEDPLRAAAALRAQGHPPALAAAALTQARLRARAVAKFGADAQRMLFTSAGLEQATRAVVANRRARRLAAAGVRHLADLGCGIGADTIAAARAGIRVYAVEADPATAELAAANVAALGLAERVRVECALAEEVSLTGVDAVFCDPARRRAGSGRRIFDPAAFSPPWQFVSSLPERVPRTVLKLAPGLAHGLIPAGAEAQWTSVGGDLVEATLWCGPLAEVPRRATLLAPPSPEEGAPAQAHNPKRAPPLGGFLEEGAPVQAGGGSGAPSSAAGGALWERGELTGSGQRRAPVGPVRRYLFDPDSAVVRASLVAELADLIEGNLADPDIAYVYTDAPHRTPYARCLEVRQVLPFSLKRLRAALREAGVGRAEIMKRGSALDPDRLRRDLRLAGDAAATVVLTRVAGAPTALICRAPTAHQRTSPPAD